MKIPCKFWILLVAVLSTPFSFAEDLSRAEVAKRTKPATVFVDAKSDGAGSGFCIDPSGLFITNYHVIQHIADSDTVTLVVEPGFPAQLAVKARVIRRDKDLDLALLQVEGDAKAEHKPFPALSLGKDDQLGELTELIAFGFPFGTALSKPGTYPTVSVNVVNVSSLRTDDKRELFRIQLDSNLNPGNSGGPVVDRSGKVVGVVVSGILGRGINLAIPVRLLRQFLEKPIISLTPPRFAAGQKHDPATFIAHAAMFGQSDKDLKVELVLNSAGERERRFPMQAENSEFRVSAIPYPTTKEGWDVHLGLKYADGEVQGVAKDRTIKVDQESFLLSEIASITAGSPGAIQLLNGKQIKGKIDIDSIELKLGGQTITCQLKDAVQIFNASRPEETFLQCSVVVSKKDREIGRFDQNLYFAGTRRDLLEGLSLGKFIKPLTSAVPTTYLRAISTPGDFIGQGQKLTIDGKQMSRNLSRNRIQVHAGPWIAVFASPPGKEIAVGEYHNAKRYPFNGNFPGLDITGESRGSNQLSGDFVIWELEVVNGEIEKLAVDFIQHSENVGPPFYGMIRFHSSLE